MADRRDRITGLLLGTAVGDSLGLPREGLSPRRAQRLYPGPLRQRLLGRWGMLSDDTEHACMTAHALLAAPDDPDRFARRLAWQLRWWLLALPPAIGWGTLRSLVRLWIGYSPRRSGVRSAGNGAVMRAPIIGAWLDDPDRIAPFVEASTHLTHRDPRAQCGALAIAVAAHHAVHDDEIRTDVVLDDLRRRVDDRELLDAIDWIGCHADAAHDDRRAPWVTERGVSGYVHHTVPACLHAWLRSPHDVRRAVTGVIELGGDSDSTGAIVGALVGASAGVDSIPADWLTIIDTPRSLCWTRELARRVAARDRPPSMWWPVAPLRNLVFGAIVVATALRRLLPPY